MFQKLITSPLGVVSDGGSNSAKYVSVLYNISCFGMCLSKFPPMCQLFTTNNKVPSIQADINDSFRQKNTQTSRKTGWAITNGQSRDTSNIEYTRHMTKTNTTTNKKKQKKPHNTEY